MIVISAATRPLHSSNLRMSIPNFITNQRNSTTVKMKLIWNYDVSSFSILSKSKCDEEVSQPEFSHIFQN